jgi:tubulin-specific chaperone B
VGIRLDEPSGLNDGTAKGVRIFECEEGFGSFVRGKNVTVGDFPERDLMDSDDEGEGEGGEGKPEQDEDEI